MRSNHARHVSEAPARSSRPQPDMPATAFSSTRRVVHCGLNRIHGNYLACYRADENSSSFAAGYAANAPEKIRRLGRQQDLRDQKLLAQRIVCYGSKQISSAMAGSGEVFGNFLPYDTDPACQWRGRRRCGPRC